jgi:hypothetical protein
MMFSWEGDNSTLRVWIRKAGEPRWHVYRVTPNTEAEYELHAWGRRILGVPRIVAELLVDTLPGPTVADFEVQ